MSGKQENKAYEVNFDGIVGPTHNYSGLSYGNVASQKHRKLVSHPKEAALQGLEKMKLLADLGLRQAVLPPHERPHLPTLRALGFEGNDSAALISSALQTPQILCEISSASAMWTANAATVSPSADSSKVHITPANLASKFHRSIEKETTATLLKAIFKDERYFIHHPPLPGGCQLSDEGAANHTRLCKGYGDAGVHLFVYGRKGFGTQEESPKLYPARQSLEASEAIARLHGLKNDSVIFAQQHPDAIDAGAFHNDVVAVGNRNLLFFHEDAFLNKEKVLREISAKAKARCKTDIHFIEVKRGRISLKETIDTYLFNSQILTLPDHSQLLLAPIECQEHGTIRSYLDELVSSEATRIDQVKYVNLRQSMNNGGGPACLRLRVVLTDSEWKHIHQGVILKEKLYQNLKIWINKHYRDELSPDDLSDPKLYMESCLALDELTQILGIGSVYEFQHDKSK